MAKFQGYASHVIGFIYAASFLPFLLVLLWVYHFPAAYGMKAKGLETDMTKAPFQTWNWHPVLMVLAFGTLFTQAALAFRILPVSHTKAKVVHAITQTAAAILAAIGIAVMFNFKKKTANLNLYTTHAVIGLFTTIFFGLQWLLGIIFFALPNCSQANRKKFLPIHIALGMTIYIGTCAAIISGATDRQWIGYPTTKAGDPVRSSPYFQYGGPIAVSVLFCAFIVMVVRGKPDTAQAVKDEPLLG